MEIHHLEEHLACFCYGTGKDAPIEMREIPCGAIQERFCLSHHELVFLVKGGLRYTVDGYEPSELTEGRFVFVPIGRTVNFETQADCVLFIVRQNNGLRLCRTFGIEQLYDKQERHEVPPGTTPLVIHPRLHHYLNGLRDTCEDGILCRHFFEAKTTELFVLLRAYYPKEQLRGLFRSVLSPDTEFSEFVRSNYGKYKTVNELASGIHLTARQFNRRFHRVFSCAPQEWILKEKARSIHAEVCGSDRPLKQISDDHGFAAQAHLSRFCKNTFGMTPGEMREKKRKRTECGK